DSCPRRILRQLHTATGSSTNDSLDIQSCKRLQILLCQHCCFISTSAVLVECPTAGLCLWHMYCITQPVEYKQSRKKCFHIDQPCHTAEKQGYFTPHLTAGRIRPAPSLTRQIAARQEQLRSDQHIFLQKIQSQQYSQQTAFDQ